MKTDQELDEAAAKSDGDFYYAMLFEDLVALEGSISSSESERPYRFETVGKCVEKFIEEMENEGLSE